MTPSEYALLLRVKVSLEDLLMFAPHGPIRTRACALLKEVEDATADDEDE